MKSAAKNIQIASYDDLFKTDAERRTDTFERVLIVPALKIHPYARQPYTVNRPTPDLVRLMDSIERVGIAEPLIVRPYQNQDDEYEIISGHRRDYCGNVIGLADRPIIVRCYTDDEADNLVADYNITREDLLPSEKARAYKLKLDAMRRQAGRPSQNSLQNGEDLRGKYSVQILAEQVDENVTKIQRYIRLNALIPALLDMVDKGTLNLTAAADYLSRLAEKDQTYLFMVMERDEVAPSVGQASRLKLLSDENKLDEIVMDDIMTEEKPIENKLVLKGDTLKKYFPSNYTPIQMQNTIIKLLADWQRRQQRQPER